MRGHQKAVLISAASAAIIVLTAGCDSAIISEAERAEQAGDIVNNEAMTAMYPNTFRPGSPAYIERDFEAGADSICDEIKVKQHRDICAEPDINWR